MKNLIIYFFLFLGSLNVMSAQDYQLSYERGSFINQDGLKANWKNADHLFAFDPIFLDQYKQYRKTRKTANSLAVACLAQTVTGLALIYGLSGSCSDIICGGQAVGIILFAITAPITGIVGIVVAATASGRKSKLITRLVILRTSCICLFYTLEA